MVFSKFRKKKDAAEQPINEKLKNQINQFTALRNEILAFLRLYEQFLAKIAAVEDPHIALGELMTSYADNIRDIEPDAAKQFDEISDEMLTLGKHYKNFSRANKLWMVDKLRHWCEHRDGGFWQLKREAHALKVAHDKLGRMRRRHCCCWRSQMNTKNKQALKKEYTQKLTQFQLHLDRFYNCTDYALNALFIDWMQQHRDFYKRATETVDKENSMPIIPTISI